ncbi:unnamed protein product [Brassica rapa]|uniref:Uncharacterized protein n=1 Tax=Brassica campestris TaxID=3711 RepID=A0A8D9D4J1_BRACM|nr:unnamed protein product [Brassica rapa]
MIIFSQASVFPCFIINCQFLVLIFLSTKLVSSLASYLFRFVSSLSELVSFSFLLVLL